MSITTKIGETKPVTLQMPGKNTKSVEPLTRRWTSHPIQRYTMGRFQFENGLLELTEDDDVAEFEQLLSTQPITEQMRVKSVDLGAAERMIAEMAKLNPVTTQTTDSSIGEHAGAFPRVGKGALQDSNPADVSE